MVIHSGPEQVLEYCTIMEGNHGQLQCDVEAFSLSMMS